MTTPNQNEQELAEQTGTVLLESAVLKFLATAEPEVKDSFTAFIEKHQASETLFADLEEHFPAFADILQKEIEDMRADMTSITKQDEETPS